MITNSLSVCMAFNIQVLFLIIFFLLILKDALHAVSVFNILLDLLLIGGIIAKQ